MCRHYPVSILDKYLLCLTSNCYDKKLACIDSIYQRYRIVMTVLSKQLFRQRCLDNKRHFIVKFVQNFVFVQLKLIFNISFSEISVYLQNLHLILIVFIKYSIISIKLSVSCRDKISVLLPLCININKKLTIFLPTFCQVP